MSKKTFSCYARVRSSAAAGHDRAIGNDLIDILGQSVFTSMRLDLCGVLASVGSSKTSTLPKKRTSIPLVSFARISAMLLGPAAVLDRQLGSIRSFYD